MFWASWHNSLSFQRLNLTVMEGHCFARAKIEKLYSQYLRDEKDVQWSDHFKEAMRASSADGRNTGDITHFSSVITWMLVLQRIN